MANQTILFCIEDVLERSLSGWINGVSEDDIITPLCFKTKVTLLEEHNNGQVIRVMEGAHRNNILTIPYSHKDKSGTVSYLSKDLPTNKTSLVLHKKKKLLVIDNIGDFRVEIKPSMFTGSYRIEIPERPIRKIVNPEYSNEERGGSRFIQTWFRLIPEKGNPGDIFLHYGSYSEGCLTLIRSRDFSVWNKVYLALMQCRQDSKFIAFLSVI